MFCTVLKEKINRVMVSALTNNGGYNTNNAKYLETKIKHIVWRRGHLRENDKHLVNTVKPTKYINHFANDMVVRPLDNGRDLQSGFDVVGHGDSAKLHG